jgi:hypothetical protein
VGNFLVGAVLGTRPAFGQAIRSDWVGVKAAMFYLERRAAGRADRRRSLPALTPLRRATGVSLTPSSGYSLKLTAG